MVPQSLVVFGPQIGVPDSLYLDWIRRHLLEIPDTAPLVDSIVQLQTFWDSTVREHPALRHVPGRVLIDPLCQWIQNGIFLPNEIPNIVLAPLTLLTHVIEYLAYLREVGTAGNHTKLLQDDEDDDENSAYLGLCIGMLSAATIRSSTTKSEVIRRTAVAVRIAVLIGATVDADGRFATPATEWRSFLAQATTQLDEASLQPILVGYPEVCT